MTLHMPLSKKVLGFFKGHPRGVDGFILLAGLFLTGEVEREVTPWFINQKNEGWSTKLKGIKQKAQS